MSAALPDIVVGSGPSGVAVATALLARGRHVLMIDGGKRLEPERAAARTVMSRQSPDTWDAGALGAWQSPQHKAPPGAIRRYGSDFALAPADQTFAEGAEQFHLRASLAVGGLSNLWGSALLPYASSDMDGWPISPEGLAPHYAAVADFLPVAGRNDDLAPLFPALKMEGRAPLPPSPQARILLERFADARAALAQNGMVAGQSRLAVSPGCALCGQCLHGCPWGLIWSAQKHLTRLIEQSGFSYRPGQMVCHLSDQGAGASLQLADGGQVHGRRIFLATGTLETARILMASGLAPQGLTLRDSAHGFLPALHRWSAGQRPDRGPFHTLPQAFVELMAPDLSPHLIHAQIYSWNDYYARDLIARFGKRLPFIAPLWQALARRLIVAQIFLHSDHSASAHLTLAPDGRLKASLIENPDSAPLFALAARRVGAGLRAGGLQPLSFAARLDPAGSGFHAGASLPMQVRSAPGGSDLLGRPHGLQHVHVCDASVLPAIPATTITLPVMANAHRIGSLAP
ncbi:MAG: GMC oxidoreductase [Rhodobacteraceae bacterium]|nr:GMC oxidoreductase [Paracoccaceae bacterium]